MNQVIEVSTLAWVKEQLDETLKEARQALEAHVERPQDVASASALVDHLHQVYGTLQMVEVYGASLLAEEMEQVARAVAAGAVGQHDDACEVLMRAMLQLPDYLDRLSGSYRDIPLVLLPLMNDLRAARGETLLSDNALFAPNLDAGLPEHLVENKMPGNVRQAARELRPQFQRGLLGWLRGQDTPASLNALRDSLEHLQGLGGDARLVRIWWAAGGVVDSLIAGVQDNTIALKRLLGQLDREVKRLIDMGESALMEDAREDLFKNLLFYCAQAPSETSPRVAEIQQTYRLRDLLPDAQELEVARESLAGQNSELFETVSLAVKEELARLKDGLDIVLRGGCADSSELAPLTGALRSLGDTLGMLSLGAARKATVGKAAELQSYVDTAQAPPGTLLMDVASTLLFVESSVDRMGFGGPTIDDEAGIDAHLAEDEYRQVMDAVIDEAIADIVRAKEAVVAYTESGQDRAHLGEVPQWLGQVKGGLLLLGETRPAALVDSIARYVEKELVELQKQASVEELDSLADAVCGLEYYLESRKEHRASAASAIAVAEQGVGRLGYPADPDTDASVDTVGDSPESAASEDGELAPLDAPGAEPEVEDDIFEFDFSLLDEEPGPGLCDDSQEAMQSPAFDMPGQTDCVDQPVDGMVCGDLIEQPAGPGVEAIHQAEVPAPAAVADDVDSIEPPETESDADDGLPVIGDEVDEEILEIFIEEAEEELASIAEQLPHWLADPDDGESLATIRRSYHTLKGSGRLVGAMRIGEFAWAFENMLNRLIDGAIQVSPASTDLLRQALDALPELVAQVREGTPTSQPIGRLMRGADAICRGEAEPVTNIDDGGEIHVETGSNLLSDGAADDGQRPESAYESDDAASGVEMPYSDEDVAGDAPELPLSAEVGMPADDHAEACEELTQPSEDGIMDPQLYEIFNSESRAHLTVIRQFLDSAAVGETQVNESLARALHTMHGSAHMAEAHPIAELAGELEKLLKMHMSNDRAVSESLCTVLEDSASIVDGMLSSLPVDCPVPAHYGSTLRQVSELLGQFLATSEDGQAEENGVAVEGGSDIGEDVHHGEAALHEPPAPATDELFYAGHDEELLGIFLEEGAANLETIESALHRWRRDENDVDALAKLQRALHTLKGGARMAELAAIGDVAHALESLVNGISESHAGADEDAMNGVQCAVDRLAGLLEQVQNRQPLASPGELVEQLGALRQRTQEAAASGDGSEETAADWGGGAETTQTPAGADEDPYAAADPELLAVFIEEADDILEHLDQTLRSWRHDPGNHAVMAELQRELHTLKGGARMADITEIGDLSHAVESLLVKVSQGDAGYSDAMFQSLEQAQDALVGMVDRVRHRQVPGSADVFIASLEQLRDGPETMAVAETGSGKPAATERVVAARMDADTEHEERRTRSRSVQELVRVKADLLDNMVNYAGEVSIYRSRLEQQIGAYRFNLVEMEQTVARVREQLRKLEIETEAQILYRYEREEEALGKSVENSDFDPLEMDRYSHMQQLSRSLMESVSDLSSIQGLLDNITRESETLLLQQSRVNTELQEGLMRTRMVPFLGLAARMRRIVRQTAQELGKKAELELSGAEGEMDRTVVDRIIAPIEHMLRNAISHGIETPQQRLEKGKPETGIIRITLEREASDLVLRIADDGAGINLGAIRKKAIERGFVAADAEVSDNDVLQFILETGFSTAEKVTQVSGRGVGMDVVTSEVKQLGGVLHIDSEFGQGTTFTVRLPFTLALNQALLIEVGDDTYAIPLSSIEGIVRMRREDLKAHYDDPDSRFEYGGYAYEVRHLGTVLGTGAPRIDTGPRRLPVLLARLGDFCVAFHVENLIGSREIVVKSVGPQIGTVRGVSGATILGDGRVVMILDVAALLRGGSIALDQINSLSGQLPRTEGLTVMVVDDSITVRKVTTRLLERNDMNVIAAKDGVDAVSKLQEHIPDIMLLDIEMPRMDGFELATHVRNEPRLRDIPMIMITSRTGDKHRQRAMQIGVNRYLGKPFQESELLDNIQAVLEETRVDG